MANETEIFTILRAASDENLLNACQPQSIAFHQYVNTALEIIDVLNKESGGKTIKDIAREVAINYNTACIYLRCLDKLGVLKYEEYKENWGMPKKYYFLIS